MKRRFFRPSDESASVARKIVPNKQPAKWEDAGRPLVNGLADSSPHSDMIVEEFVDSGSPSVKTLMNDCCESNIDASETSIACRICDHVKSPMLCSITSSNSGVEFEFEVESESAM